MITGKAETFLLFECGLKVPSAVVQCEDSNSLHPETNGIEALARHEMEKSGEEYGSPFLLHRVNGKMSNLNLKFQMTEKQAEIRRHLYGKLRSISRKDWSLLSSKSDCAYFSVWTSCTAGC